MAQIFPKSANVLARVSLLALLLAVIGIGLVAWGVENASYITEQNVIHDQPVPFSHEHHVRGLGIDCRYCHTSVTTSAFAGVPPTRTCMTCHSQIWTNASLLEPVRESWRNNQPMRWNRVNNTPGYVYFDHAIHVNKGVGCATCHGPVDRMPLMWQEATLQMSWCLDCHRNPEKYLRPLDQVFNMNYQPPPNQLQLGRELAERYQVRPRQALENCSTCHR